MSASTGSLLVSIAILFFWNERSPGISARPLELVIPAGRFSWNTSTSGTPVSTTGKDIIEAVGKEEPAAQGGDGAFHFAGRNHAVRALAHACLGAHERGAVG